MKTHHISLVAILLSVLHLSVASGQNNSWTNTSAGKWELSNNWSLVVAPTNTHSVFITNVFSKTVTIDAITAGTTTMTVSNLTVSAPLGSANMLFLNSSGTGTPLRVLNSATISSRATLLVYSNSEMQVVSVSSTGSLIVDGGGFVNLFDGGALIATNHTTIIGNTGTGQVSVNGTLRTANLNVGRNAGALGTLTLQSGLAEMRADWSVGSAANATGTVWMTGGQLVANAFTSIGLAGSGQMTVSNGTVLAATMFAGVDTGARGTLTMAGGTITSGLGGFSESALTVGRNVGSTGTVWITGSQFFATNTVGGGSLVIIGQSGVGRLTLSNGIVNAGTVTIAKNAGSAGTLTMAGGILMADRLVATNSAATIAFPAGTMTLRGAEVANGQFFIVGGPGQTAVLNLVAGTNQFDKLLLLGSDNTSTGVLWMTGGLLSVTNGLYVSVTGVAQMTVSNGTWNVGLLVLGDSPSARGTLTLVGGTTTVSSQLIVASDGGTHALWLTGGQLTTTGTAATLIGNVGVGRVIVSNGTWQAGHVIVSPISGSQGSLTIAGGVSSVYSNLTVGNFACNATGIVVVSGGQLRVTNSAANAVLEVRSGTLTQSGGTLDVDRLIITNSCARFIRTGGTLITGLVTLAPFGDADGDGMANAWELAAGLDPFDPSDAALDPDGDGKTNLQEYFTDTDPHDPEKYLRITSIVRTNNNILITWPTEEFYGLGIFYRVLWGTNLFTGVTNVLSPNIFGFGTTSTNYLDVGGATNVPPRFYRLLGNID